MLDESKGFFKPAKAFVLSKGVLSGPTRNLFHSGSCFCRWLFDQAHGYRHMGSGQDMDLEQVFEGIIGPNRSSDSIESSEIYYVYRWNGTESFHLSGFGRDKAKG